MALVTWCDCIPALEQPMSSLLHVHSSIEVVISLFGLRRHLSWLGGGGGKGYKGNVVWTLLPDHCCRVFRFSKPCSRRRRLTRRKSRLWSASADRMAVSRCTRNTSADVCALLRSLQALMLKRLRRQSTSSKRRRSFGFPTELAYLLRDGLTKDAILFASTRPHIHGIA